jgi:hypothetical protein
MSGTGGTATGGTGTTSDGGAGGSTAGGSDAGGAGASGGEAGQSGTGGSPDAATASLSVCIRLQSPSVLSFDVTRTYDHTVFADCRVKWVSNLYLEVDQREVFLNNLLAWNMRFWGCSPPPPDDFALIFKPAPLTRGDAAALIDDYISVATQALGLSTPEIDEMRAALDTLANSVVANESNGFSNSQCSDSGAGGAGSGGSSGSGGTGGSVGTGGSTGGAPSDAGSRTDTGSTSSDASSEAGDAASEQ